MNTFDLTPFCRTKTEARDFSSQLAVLSGKVYQTDFHFETALMGVLGLRYKDAFLNLMRTSGSIFNTPADVKNFLEEIRRQLAALPVLSLTLAFEPTEATLKILTDWFLKNSNRHILFDITVDPLLIAGVGMQFNGRHIEYSIKPTVFRIIQETLNPPAVKPTTQSMPPHQSIEAMSLGR